MNILAKTSYVESIVQQCRFWSEMEYLFNNAKIKFQTFLPIIISNTCGVFRLYSQALFS